ncbi:MAG: hypothetical protein ACKVHE_04575 [Planctomycetales bacterium]|jgi:hypothetical protein
MQSKYPWLNAFASLCRIGGVIVALVGVFNVIVYAKLALTLAVAAALGGVFGCVGLFALSEFIDMVINARHDLGDVRFYLSTISKPKPSPEGKSDE